MSGTEEINVIYRISLWIGCLGVVLLIADSNLLTAQTKTVTCSSKEGERQSCAVDTAAGVALQRSWGPAECLLGKTWGYDNQSIWVSDGCAGEFELGEAVPASTTQAPPPRKEQHIETWGAIEAGKGFLIGRTTLRSSK